VKKALPPQLPPGRIEEIREEFDAYVESRPPTARATSAFDNIAARLETPTGVHDLRELQRQVREHERQAAVEKIAALERERDKALTTLEASRKFWLDVAKSVLAAVIAAALIAAGALLSSKE
jgi:hypothetical protein